MTTRRNIHKYTFDTKKILGEGSYATVYKGYTNDTKEPRALKIVDYSSYSKEQITQLENEVKTLALLSNKFPDPTTNPFIHIYDAITLDRKKLCIVTELAAGEELDIYTTRFVAGIPERIAKLVFLNVLKAVQLLHEQNICHLDLKLENIMYDRKFNKIKILDFGFSCPSKTKEDETVYHNTFCGSMHYVAPEIVDHIPFDGCKADIWALGVCLFSMLTGNFPFDSEEGDDKVIFAGIRENKPNFPSFLSTGALSILKEMMNCSPDKRGTVSSLLSHPWFSC